MKITEQNSGELLDIIMDNMDILLEAYLTKTHLGIPRHHRQIVGDLENQSQQ